MDIAARLDDIGRPVWIALMVLGFILFWPVGLAVLAYLVWSRRMGCHGYGRRGHWHNAKGGDLRDDIAHAWQRGWGRPASSGNLAFDEYRAETLRRLEQEQRDFRDFLDRLRFAKDKAEFDEFLAARRHGDQTGEPPAGGPTSNGPTSNGPTSNGPTPAPGS